ncbi:nucleotidyltransferase domain-containing protein [Candidatus Parabeggiatoa sp. HSG14]|uniref:nucleotidyltransferase domain-containing protein n=1 Tax=Candidatus Parabeggiatoa sp. HSG14 TaxID=3055593 RepID=UPI0025A6EA85|nr:nucleotidyltransferase domain-containing protein [Thiotrichales bacterium HSG14]
MQKQIQQHLQTIEQDESVSIFLACESGSRAWGFPSQDSDFDVRFLYVHRPEWYLSIDKKRDVIECPIEGLLDINGWDIRKALRLLKKSNAVLFEWLYSPIVYQEKSEIIDKIRKLVPVYFSPPACHHHYLHLAKNTVRRHLQNEVINLKKIFYVLRPIFACHWIEANLGIVPMSFDILLEQVENFALKTAIFELLQHKKQGKESSSEVVPSAFRSFG